MVVRGEPRSGRAEPFNDRNRARRGGASATFALALVVLAVTACGVVVEGELKGRPSNLDLDPRRTVVVIWNHGFSPEAAGTYRPEAPPIIERLVERNRDVVLFKQLRNGTWLGELDHSAYVDAAIASLVAEQHVPVENIILSGQSCGAWGSLQTAAFRYPNIGGIVAFAPGAARRSSPSPASCGYRACSSSTRETPFTPWTTGPASRRRR